MGQQLADALAFRRVVEPGAAALAATVILLRRGADRLRAAWTRAATHHDALRRGADSRLHLVMADVADRFAAVGGGRRAAARRATPRGHSGAAPQYRSLGLEHEAVVAAILARRPDRAGVVMEEHCDATSALLRGFLACSASPHDDTLLRLVPDRPTLERPVLIHAMNGFVDAGGAVNDHGPHPRRAGAPTRASFDVDQLHDYRARRPPMVFMEDHWESIEAPALTVHQVTDAAGADFLLLAGPEPDTQWERFVDAVERLVRVFDVRLTVGVNAIPMGVPHTRPVRLTAHATRKDLVAGYTPWVGTVVVPGSASNVLEFRFGERNLDAMGLAGSRCPTTWLKSRTPLPAWLCSRAWPAPVV